MNKLVIIIFFTMLFFPNQLIGQNSKFIFDNIGIDDGLSQSTVNSITQDKFGFMWFGTDNGLNRYDGYSVKVFKHELGNSNSISDNTINCLLSDSKGDLWIGAANGGVDRYIISKDKFHHYMDSLNYTPGINNKTVTSLFEDSYSNIWIGTNSGLKCYIREKNIFISYSFDSVNTVRHNKNSITTICEDKERNLWVGTYKGLFKNNLMDDHGFIKMDNLNANPTTPYGEHVTSLFIDRRGSLWVGTFDQSLKNYNKSDNTFRLFPNTSKAINTVYEDSNKNIWLGSIYMSLQVLNLNTNIISQIQDTKNDIIKTLYGDRTGILWIGTGFRGVFIYDQNKNRFNRYLGDPFNPNVVMSIVEDRDGELWVGTYGNGLKHLNKKRDIVNTFKYNPNDDNSISSDKIFSLCITSDGILWIGTIGGGLNYYDKTTGSFRKYTQHSPINSKGLSNNDITALYEASNGDLLIGNVRGGIDILNRKTETFTHHKPVEAIPNLIGGGKSVTVFYEDKKGTIWAGTLDGLKYLNNKSNSFENYSLRAVSNKKNANYKGITSLLFTDSTVWIGTTGDGLIRLNPKSNSVISYTSDDGLPDNTILSILEDNADNLWMSTNNGISKFNTRKQKFRNYNIDDGLQSNEFNQGAYFKSLSGEMFFGGVNGFNSFYPHEIKDNKNIPPVYITSFKVFDKLLKLPKTINAMEKISLSYSQNFLSFEFVALNYTAPSKNQYAYFLKGFDKAWHFVSAKQRYASYTNLDPGEYVLNVKASNNDGLWNEEGTSLRIQITPPFWMTWWFKAVVIIIVISTIVFIYKYRVEQILKIERMRVEIAADLHDEIGSSLGSIVLRSRILQNQESWTEKSKEELKRIYITSSQIAAGMRDIVWFVNPNFDKLDDMILRMKDTAQDLLGSIRYEFISPEEILSKKLSLEFRKNVILSYKEILHNITKHSKATEVEIKVHFDNGVFNLEISDNGVGFDPESLSTDSKIKAPGNGLINLKRRIHALGGQVKIESGKENGTNIIIKIKTT